MTVIGFYHLTRTPLEQALPRLLEKVLAGGMKAVVRIPDPERRDLLDRALWTYARESFLPHGTAADGFAERQPIYLAEGEENPAGAGVLVLIDDAPAPDLGSFQRVIVMFDGGDGEALAAARRLWRSAAKAGHECTYWQQDERGSWRQGAASRG